MDKEKRERLELQDESVYLSTTAPSLINGGFIHYVSVHKS